MVKGKRTGKLEVTSKPKVKKPSKGPLSEYRVVPVAEMDYKKERVGIEDMKKDMLKMMDKVDRLEDAFKYLKARITRLDGRG